MTLKQVCSMCKGGISFFSFEKKPFCQNSDFYNRIQHEIFKALVYKIITNAELITIRKMSMHAYGFNSCYLEVR